MNHYKQILTEASLMLKEKRWLENVLRQIRGVLHNESDPMIALKKIEALVNEVLEEVEP